MKNSWAGTTFNFFSKIDGSLKFDKKLSSEHLNYLNAFSKTKRLLRDEDILKSVKDPLRKAVNLPIGKNGEFFVGTRNSSLKNKTIIDYNSHPSTQPSCWCPWQPSDCGSELVLTDDNDLTCSKDWLIYLVKNFVEPWGYSLSGKMKFTSQQEEFNETIIVKNNNIEFISYAAFA